MKGDQAPSAGAIDSPGESSGLKRLTKEILDYLRVEDKPSKADAVFVLGEATINPVERAYELWRDGFAPKIVFISIGGSFGGDKLWGMSEVKKYKETLKNLGVPERDIIADELTTNTLAEAKASIPFMRKHGIDPHSLILVARPAHQRRAFATFSKQHPDINYINCPGDGDGGNDFDIRQRLVGEIERLIVYARKGDIENQEIPENVLRATECLKSHLRKR